MDTHQENTPRKTGRADSLDERGTMSPSKYEGPGVEARAFVKLVGAERREPLQHLEPPLDEQRESDRCKIV